MRRGFRAWLKDDSAVSAVEAALLFPVMMIILCGTVDTGVGLICNQKVINAAQMVADILAREDDITNAEMADAQMAGKLAMIPNSTATFGLDIAGIQFKNAALTPTVIWRDTLNMTANPKIATNAAGLGKQDEGVIGVTARYYYIPYFSTSWFGNVQMQEVSYVRGRRGFFVTRSS